MNITHRGAAPLPWRGAAAGRAVRRSGGFGQRLAPGRHQRHVEHIVAETPVRILVAAQPGVVVRNQLDLAGALGAVGLVQREGGGVVVGAGFGEAARQHGGILDRHRGALGHVRLHRVAGIAQQHQAAPAPQRQRVALKQRPLGHFDRAFDQRLHAFVPAVEGRAHFFDAARHPALAHVPLGLGHAGDVVDLVELAGVEVDHHVAVIGPPLGAALVREALDARDREHRAVRDVAGVLGRLGAQQGLADARVDAVGADHDIGLFDRAVGEAQLHHIALVGDAFQLLVEEQRARGDGVGQQLVEVAAVHGQVAGAVVAHRIVAQRDLRDHFAGEAVAAVPVVGVAAHVVERVLDADAPHDLHHVGPDMDARAQARERRCLLIQPDLEAGSLQQGGRGRPSESGADNCDSRFALHVISPGNDTRSMGAGAAMRPTVENECTHSKYRGKGEITGTYGKP
ncbi:hypothetical protein CBM2586_A11144 [Cupriavidus phytorum]|uniref:Uncharacterized protein n=1 Tax=Cupriavidus taiwanensis TaxID=164546 RepID=A0A975WRX9_9BURK|nr:hypothetical protein CBM2586_A11144 [Cupriavidus taiwanensis]